MSRDTLIRQLAEADVFAPEHDLPESARTSSVALTEIRRRIDMDVKEITRPVEQDSRRGTGWLVAAAAFAGVVLVAGLIAVLSNRNVSEPADTPVPTTQAAPPTTEAAPPTTEAAPPTTEVVEPTQSDIAGWELVVLGEFVEAVNSADPDAIEGVLTPGFTLTSGEQVRSGFSAPADVAALQFAYYAAEGSTFALSDCKALEYGIQCSSTWSGIVPTATFGSELPGRELITVVDGKIDSLKTTPFQSTIPWLTPGRVDLIDWVRTVSPDDAETMESGTETYGGYRLEVAPLWQQYAEQWLEAGRP